MPVGELENLKSWKSKNLLCTCSLPPNKNTVLTNIAICTEALQVQCSRTSVPLRYNSCYLRNKRSVRQAFSYKPNNLRHNKNKKERRMDTSRNKVLCDKGGVNICQKERFKLFCVFYFHQI